MTRTFEDYFSELQADMVSIGLEYINNKADYIYIYSACENNMFSFDLFYKINGKFLRIHKVNDAGNGVNYNVSMNRMMKVLEIGVDDLEKIYNLCKSHNREMPTEMKMVYNVQTGSFEAKYCYDLQYSNKENLISDDIFDQWFDEVANNND
ncbi:DUF600 domain-containing protein [Zophobihabitans entericus]|uniref:DUF600 domain-containing protein n=1 Tax=Zophobihabitans entericus TaxID=1635327 RepID=A0A6G9IER9_9GAMM|nr:DUF600 domain-containing protein [Zophobihabitans entericus]QIQ22194.1 DUF600 domain-containing protein [Zophobihabitans entericus]